MNLELSILERRAPFKADVNLAAAMRVQRDTCMMFARRADINLQHHLMYHFIRLARARNKDLVRLLKHGNSAMHQLR